MEYFIMFLALIAFVIAIFLLEGYRAKQREKAFVEKIKTKYMTLNDKKYTPDRFSRLSTYLDHHRSNNQIDAITWNDLGMDDVFMRMNYTLSATGEEYLYYFLHTLKQNTADLDHFENVVKYFDENPEERVKFQYKMSRLGYTGKYSLYEYIENLDSLGERSNKKHHICNALYLVAVLIMLINVPIGVLAAVSVMIYNIISYFKEKGIISPYIVSFAYIIRLLNAGEQVVKLQKEGLEEEIEALNIHIKNLSPLRSGSFLVLSGESNGVASGDILSALLDYIKMAFHIDLIRFNSMYHFLEKHIADVDGMITVLGYLESACCTWIYRQSMEGEWCIPKFDLESKSIEMENAYHPLIAEPVKNSICTDIGVLLTGSNASGKSTFLKTVAINTVLAQSIHTCPADSYRAPLYYVYSSMSLRDDLSEGESYYIVEIKALKRILDVAKDTEKNVLCFVDEVLRGTNTVERIAASTEILKALQKEGTLCFAATHDIELTHLLEGQFDNYHFEEDIQEGDIQFNYKLLSGRAVTRNAIKLLELLQYDDAITKQAAQRAEAFLSTGEWR